MKKQPKFKVGDKVVVVKCNDSGLNSIFKNDLGKVITLGTVYHKSQAGNWYNVRESDYGFCDQVLELATKLHEVLA